MKFTAAFGIGWFALVVGLVPVAGAEEAPGETDPVEDAAEPAGRQSLRSPGLDGWEPDGGDRLEHTREGARFEGLIYLHPVRLHLSLGGHVEGSYGGVDSETEEVLLVLPRSRFRIAFPLIGAVTPLGPVDLIDDVEVREILDRKHTETRLMPTWRSHVGLALSFLAPGTGQFIQKKDPELGFLFMGLEIFMAAGAILAAFAAPSLELQDRIGITAGFATVGVGISITAAVHAFQTGREPKEVEVGQVAEGRRRRSGSP